MLQVELEQLKQYMKLELEITKMEKDGPLKEYEEIVRQIEDVSETIKNMEINVSQKEMQT